MLTFFSCLCCHPLATAIAPDTQLSVPLSCGRLYGRCPALRRVLDVCVRPASSTSVNQHEHRSPEEARTG